MAEHGKSFSPLALLQMFLESRYLFMVFVQELWFPLSLLYCSSTLLWAKHLTVKEHLLSEWGNRPHIQVVDTLTEYLK